MFAVVSNHIDPLDEVCALRFNCCGFTQLLRRMDRDKRNPPRVGFLNRDLPPKREEEREA